MNDDHKPKGPMGVSMQGSSPQRRKSSLSREVQIEIGKRLEIPYNEIVNEGVPDRFVELIRRLETEGVKEGVASSGEGAGDSSDDEGSER
jgi:Anti-sigma factor NepR